MSSQSPKRRDESTDLNDVKALPYQERIERDVVLKEFKRKEFADFLKDLDQDKLAFSQRRFTQAQQKQVQLMPIKQLSQRLTKIIASKEVVKAPLQLTRNRNDALFSSDLHGSVQTCNILDQRKDLPLRCDLSFPLKSVRDFNIVTN